MKLRTIVWVYSKQFLGFPDYSNLIKVPYWHPNFRSWLGWSMVTKGPREELSSVRVLIVIGFTV